MKYIIRRQIAGSIRYYEADDLKEFAKEYLAFHIDQNEEGGWEVWLYGENVAHYNDEWTKEEVERNYFASYFTKRIKLHNFEIYSKCGD